MPMLFDICNDLFVFWQVWDLTAALELSHKTQGLLLLLAIFGRLVIVFFLYNSFWRISILLLLGCVPH